MQAMIYSGMNGIGLALVVPCVQSLIADYTLAERRGAAFGVLYFTGAIGAKQMIPVCFHPEALMHKARSSQLPGKHGSVPVACPSEQCQGEDRHIF